MDTIPTHPESSTPSSEPIRHLLASKAWWSVEGITLLKLPVSHTSTYYMCDLAVAPTATARVPARVSGQRSTGAGCLRPYEKFHLLLHIRHSSSSGAGAVGYLVASLLANSVPLQRSKRMGKKKYYLLTNCSSQHLIRIKESGDCNVTPTLLCFQWMLIDVAEFWMTLRVFADS
jgi:hypothetical protein